MRKAIDQYFIITTMDGVPVTYDDGSIVQYTSTQSMRQTAKHLTFTKRARHHTRGITKNQWFIVKKHFQKHGFIPLGMLR